MNPATSGVMFLEKNMKTNYRVFVCGIAVAASSLIFSHNLLAENGGKLDDMGEETIKKVELSAPDQLLKKDEVAAGRQPVIKKDEIATDRQPSLKNDEIATNRQPVIKKDEIAAGRQPVVKKDEIASGRQPIIENEQILMGSMIVDKYFRTPRK